MHRTDEGEHGEETDMASKHLVRGVLAGMAGGLVAAWMMNEFSGTLGKKLDDAVESPEDKRELAGGIRRRGRDDEGR